MDPQRQRDARVAADSLRYAGLGLTFAATVGLFGLGGFWLDRRLGSSPLFLIVAVFLGFGLGLYSMVSKLPGSRRRGAGRDPHDPTS